ncbi:MAG: SLC13 family permease [Anaerolineales bacterium]
MNIWITLIIVTITYIGITLGKFPRLRANRTTIALIGVGLLLVFGQITFGQISGFLNLDTLVLLFGMVVINVNLQLAGFFRLAGAAILKFTRGPRSLLALEIVVAGLLSALFLNDTICLVLAPLILNMTLNAKRNPVPYLIALATASNIGSVATLTGNPQNMIIGIASNISYLRFAAALTPVALLGLGGVWLVIILFYRDEFNAGVFESVHVPETEDPLLWPLLYKSVFVVVGLLIALLVGAPIAESAFIAGCVLLLIAQVTPAKILDAINTDLLFFFGALFIISGTIESS